MQPDDQLTREEGNFLLEIARKSLKSYIKDKKTYTIEENHPSLTPLLKDKGACFVTYHKKGNLRGCIGTLMASKPLYKEVLQKAIDAAIHDPRFPAIQTQEIEQVHIEVSVLFPPTPIKSLEEFIIGQHGIIFTKAHYSSVFLPQVALEQDWTKEQTMQHLCLKAGLPPNAWEKDSQMHIFKTQYFSEPEA